MSTSFTTKLTNCFPCLTTKLCNIFFARQSITTVCLTTKWTMGCTCLTTQFASVYRTEQNILLTNEQVGTVPTAKVANWLQALLTNWQIPLLCRATKVTIVGYYVPIRIAWITTVFTWQNVRSHPAYRTDCLPAIFHLSRLPGCRTIYSTGRLSANILVTGRFVVCLTNYQSDRLLL